MSNPFDQAADAFEFTKPEPEKKPEPAKPGTERSTEPGRVYDVGDHDIPEPDYHADPCPTPSLSASIAKVLLKRSPLHAWASHPRLNPEFEPQERETLDLGSMFHALILGSGPEIECFDAENWTKAGNAGREFKKECRARGSIPVLLPKFAEAESMVASVRAQLSGHQELAYAMANGAPERTLIWIEETTAGPIYCRARLDWRADRGNLFPDWKSTEVGAGPDEWGAKTMWQLDSEIQAAFYARGISKVLGTPSPAIFFAVVENFFPYALATMRPTPSAVAMATRQVEYAIQLWGMCVHSNRWPGYRRQMAWVDPPAWKEKLVLEREERGELDPKAAWAMYNALPDKDERPALDGPVDDEDAFGLPPIPPENRI